MTLSKKLLLYTMLQALKIGVGTVIAHCPRADPDGPNSGIRFLP